jgi:hypothetical protein
LKIEAIKFLKLVIIAALIAAIIAATAALITGTTEIENVVDVLHIVAQNLALAGSHCLEMQTATTLVAPLVSKMKLQVLLYRPVTHIALEERVCFLGL